MPLKNWESPEEYKDPAAFWRKIGPDYKSKIDPNDPSYKKQESMLLDFLNKLFYVHPIKNVLELGCGYGRITKHLLDYFRPSHLEVIDCSGDQVMDLIATMKARHYFRSTFQYKIMDLLSDEFDKFARDNEHKFDLVLAVEFLMHVPTEKIHLVIHNMLKLSKLMVVNVDWATSGPYSEGIRAPENFMHEYYEIYKNSGLALHVSQIPINGIDQSLFIAQIDPSRI